MKKSKAQPDLLGMDDDDLIVAPTVPIVASIVPVVAPTPSCDDRIMPSAVIYRGHVTDALRAMPDQSVQCIITSPPYWGLRDYKCEPIIWGGDTECDHRWGPELIREMDVRTRAGGTQNSAFGSVPSHRNTIAPSLASRGAFCSTCSAWRGALGLEPTPEMFVEHLVIILREACSVLRNDGVLFLNIGDSYSSGAMTGASGPNSIMTAGLRPKNLIGIPWMLAFALRADGWYLRSDIIWAKGISFCESYSGSAMPESITDRPTKGHEYVFMLTKSERYFWDIEAAKERSPSDVSAVASKTEDTECDGARNIRSVWAINPVGFDGEFCTACRRFFDGPLMNLIRVVKRGISSKHDRGGEVGHRSGSFGSGPSPEDVNPQAERDIHICPCGASDAWLSHFAPFPEDLVLPMVKAATSEIGCCVACGAPWERANTETIGWRPTCTCGVNRFKPSVVLDPFTGAGTTAMVSLKLGRSFIGAELNSDYADMAAARVRHDAPLFNNVRVLDITDRR